MKWCFIALIVWAYMPWALAQSCRQYLSLDSTLYKTPELLDRESILSNFENLALKPSETYKTVIGRGGEGVAYLSLRAESEQNYRAVVHKHFDMNNYRGLDYLVSLDGFRHLRDLKKQGLLPGFDLAQVYGVSESRNRLYLEYIHGDNLLHLTHVKANPLGFGPQYVVRSDIGAKELQILQRFDRVLNEVYEIWNRNPEVYIEVAEPKILGQELMVILLVKDKETDRTVLDLNLVNTVYDGQKDRFVIIDPY